MDNSSFLAQQVSGSIGKLHALLDEIGVPGHEREAREAEVSLFLRRGARARPWLTRPQLFAALSEALESQVRLVTAEKKELVDEAKRCITAIRQMEASLDGSKQLRRSYDDDELHITYPLTRCLQLLREKHSHVARLHKERFEQVKSESPQAQPCATRR